MRQEKHEMEDFEEEKTLFVNTLLEKFSNKKKILGKMSKFLTDFCKIFAYSFISEHSKQFFYFEKKKLAFLSGWGSTPPPPQPEDTSIKNAFI